MLLSCVCLAISHISIAAERAPLETQLLPVSDSYQPHNPPAINLIAINDTSNHQRPAATTATATPCQIQQAEMKTS